MTKEQLPIVSNVDDNSLEEFKGIDDIVFVAYIDPTDTELSEIFGTVAAEHHREFVFGIVTDVRLADSNKLAVPSIACHKRRYKDDTAMNGRFDKETLEKFLEFAAAPLIGEITKKNIDEYMSVSPTSTPWMSMMLFSWSPFRPASLLHTFLSRPKTKPTGFGGH